MSSRRRTAPKTPTEDARLLEQVKLLTEENKRLRDLLTSQGPSDNFAVNTNNIADPSRLKSSTQIMAASTTTQATPQKSGKGCSCKGNCGTRVCGCVKKKSACSEVCRCSDAHCQNQDPNKENKEENSAQLTREDEENIEKLSRLNLKDKKQSKREKKSMGRKQSEQEEHGTPGPSNKPLEEVDKPSSIFSPDTEDNVFNFQDTEIANFSLRFGNDVAQTETAMNNDESHETREEGAKRTKRPLRNTEKSRRGGLKVPKASRKLRSMSSEESISDKGKNNVPTEVEDHTDDPIDSQQGTSSNHPKNKSKTNIKKKSAQKGKKNVSIEKENSKEDPIESKDESDNDNSENNLTTKATKVPVKNGKNNNLVEKENGEDPMELDKVSMSNNSESKSKTKMRKKPAQKGRKNNLTEKQSTENLIETDDEIDSDNSKNDSTTKTNEMSVKEGKNNNSIKKENTEDEMKLAEEWSNSNNNSDAETQISSQDISVKEENNFDLLDEQNNVENRPTESESSDQSDHETRVNSENEEAMVSEEEIIHEQTEYSETSSLNISMQSDPSRQQNTFSPKANEDFNPMIPRRQLSRSPAQLPRTTPQLLQSPAQLSRSPAARSPINQSLNTTSRRMHDPSERPLPIPLQEEPEFEPLPPEELSRDIVDWEQHKQRLVHCRKCNRTFHPYRINKHEKFCKRV